ncbi:MAG: tetratricopeptide repeat protein, partial [Planctomycetota bacterium]|nr:tetratricopeptide repeat protein [Planctomycetota bacterium]
RADRYSSAAELGADIRRYLADEPITARQQTTNEAIRRFMRKHRTATSAIVIICLVIIAGLISVSVFAYRAEVARAEENRQRLVAEEATRRVEQERERLEEIVEFQAGMIKNVNPNQMGRSLREGILDSTRNKAENANYELEEIEFLLADQELFLDSFNPTDVAKGLFDVHILRSGLEQIPGRFDGDPKTEAAVREIIGDSYETLGLYALAEPQYVRALEIRSELLGPYAPETLESTDDLGILRMSQGRIEESRDLYAAALDGRREVLGEEHPDTIATLQNLGNSMLLLGDLEGARSTLQQAYDSSLRLNGELYPNTITILGNLGGVHSRLGELEVAEELLTQALRLTRRLYGEDTSETMEVLRNLAGIAMRNGDPASASEYLTSSLAACRKYLGDRHPDTLRVMYELGTAYLNLNQPAEADPLLNAAYNGQREIRGAGHPETFESLFQLSLLYLSQDDFERSQSFWTLAHGSALQVFGVDHPLTFTTLYARGDIATKAGLFTTAEDAIRELEELCRQDDLVNGANRCDRVPALYQALYARWDEAEPGQGYDIQAARWNEIMQSGENLAN